MAAFPSQITPHRAQRVDLPGPYGPIAVLRAYPPVDGPQWHATALLVPGYTGSKEDFAPLIDPIAEAGIGVVSVDLPGQFESSGPDDEDAYHPKPLGEIVAELAVAEAKSGRRVLLLGHSYGGLVARAAVLDGAPIAGLTLLCSGPAELPPGARRSALDAGEPILRRQGIEAALMLREEMDAANRPDAPAELRALLRERFLASSPAGLLGMADALRGEPDRVGELLTALRAAQVPCLVACGTEDDAWPVSMQRSMAERLDAEFAAVPGAAHSPATENPPGLLDVLLPTWRTWLTDRD